MSGAALIAGETRSEGGFKENKVSVASLLDVQEATDKSGKKYYKYEILTRTGELFPSTFAGFVGVSGPGQCLKFHRSLVWQRGPDEFQGVAF